MINTDLLKTSIEFAKNIRTTGAFRQSSKKVENEITKYVDPNRKQVIVEFGTGHGNITQRILERLHPESQLYSFEVNPEFVAHVREMIDDDRLTIVNAGAETIAEHVDGAVDSVISSLPLTLFSKEDTERLLRLVYDQLVPGGHMSQLLYSSIHKKKFVKAFDHLYIKRFINVPMEYIHHGSKN